MKIIGLHPTYYYWSTYLNSTFGKKKLSILDFGCGNAVLLDILGPDRIEDYLGVDPSRDAIAVAKQKYHNNQNIRFFCNRDQAIPKIDVRNKYDLVILIGVLQYLEDHQIEQLLHLASQSLKPGGHLMFSTVLDTQFYKFINMYQFVFPNRYISRSSTINQIKRHSFKIITDQVRGLLIGPLVSHALVIPFDALDHYILRFRGRIGFFGRLIRIIFYPLMYLELLAPINLGYTWYLDAKK